MKFVEPGVIDITAIHDVKGARFRNKDVKHLDIMHFAV